MRCLHCRALLIDGVTHHCADWSRLQMLLGAVGGTVVQPRDPVVFYLVTFRDGSRCALTASQLVSLPRELTDEITSGQFISTEGA